MLKKIESENMGFSNLGWLKSKFHFSFAEYYNPNNINFGVLRVINDDLIEPGTGFDMHPHKDMEIVTYVVNGEITHVDSIGNKRTLKRGEIQYMSAGTGVYHSEYNQGSSILRSLQIWIYPDKSGCKPNYGDYRFQWEDRKNKLFHMVSSINGDAKVKINQDANIYSLELDKGRKISFPVAENRQAYLIQIEGLSEINSIELNERDAIEIVGEDISINAKETSHFLILEMSKYRLYSKK